MHTSQFPLYAHMYVHMSVYFHMAVYIFSCLSLFSFLSLWLQSLLLHNILELEPSWAELWVAWLLAWCALALGCATRLSQRDMQTQANKAHTHTDIKAHTYSQHTGKQDTHAADPSPAAAANFSHVSLSIFVSSMFGSTTTAKSTTAAATATVACVSIIFCRAWHWKRDKRAENNVPFPAAKGRRAATNSSRNQCRTRN